MKTRYHRYDKVFWRKDWAAVVDRISQGVAPMGLYVHWPFCLSKCPYCDFNSHVRERTDEKAWGEALCREMRFIARRMKSLPLRSIFFGGGTPSLMSPDLVHRIIEEARVLFSYEDDLEITLEANPSTFETEKFKGFREAGVNRLSLGIQSLRPDLLRFLGRSHTADEAMHALEVAQDLFPRFSFDIMYAHPDQTLEAWQEELGQVLAFHPSHLSLYQLTIEPGTAFDHRTRQGRLIPMGAELAADFYELTDQMTRAQGLPSYEVSNYARPGEACRHNLVYWEGGAYIGIGPGAHGRLLRFGKRYATHTHRVPETWLAAVQARGHGVKEIDILTPQERLIEALMMGMRLTRGLHLPTLASQTGLNVVECIGLRTLDLLGDQGLIQIEGERLAPTPQGRLCLNQVVGLMIKGLT